MENLYKGPRAFIYNAVVFLLSSLPGYLHPAILKNRHPLLHLNTNLMPTTFYPGMGTIPCYSIYNHPNPMQIFKRMLN